ncbi:hypothetical protein PRIPAC_83812, partial [Pristionchus pacificus]
MAFLRSKVLKDPEFVLLIDENAPELASGTIEPNAYYMFGFRWSVVVERKIDSTNVAYANFTLCCQGRPNSTWKCDGEVVMRPICANGAASWFVTKSRFCFLKNQRSLNYTSMEWSRFTGPAYKINGKITVEFRINYFNEECGELIADPDKFLVPNNRSDIVLLVKNKRIHVSKEFLAINSPVFESLFFGDYVEKEKGEIEIKDVDYEEFMDLLYVIYPGSFDITDYSVEHVMKLADRFQMKRVLDQSMIHLIQSKGFGIMKKFANEDRPAITAQYIIQTSSYIHQSIPASFTELDQLFLNNLFSSHDLMKSSTHLVPINLTLSELRFSGRLLHLSIQQLELHKIETDLSKNEADKKELEAVTAQAKLKAESDQKEMDGYKREMEAATAKLVQENYGLSAELEKSRAAIDEYKVERDKSAAAFKDVITLKNAKIRQLEVELMKVQAESDFHRDKVKSMVEAESTNGVAALQLKVHQLTTESELIKNEIDRYESVITKLTAESNELNKELQSERAKIRQLEVELAKVGAESAVYQEKVKSIVAAELTNGVAGLQIKLERLTTESEFRKSEIDRYKKELAETTTKSKTVSNDLHKSLKTDRAKIRQLEIDLANAQAQSAVYQTKLNSKIATESRDMVSFRAKNRQLEVDLANAQAQSAVYQ